MISKATFVYMSRKHCEVRDCSHGRRQYTYMLFIGLAAGAIKNILVYWSLPLFARIRVNRPETLLVVNSQRSGHL